MRYIQNKTRYPETTTSWHSFSGSDNSTINATLLVRYNNPELSKEALQRRVGCVVFIITSFLAGVESADQCLLNSKVLSCFSGVIIRLFFLFPYCDTPEQSGPENYIFRL